MIPRASTHASRLDRWLGPGQAERISQAMANWYGPPILVANVPGRVYACKGGDFCGPLKGGSFASLLDYAIQRLNRIARGFARRQGRVVNAGFASLSDLIAEATTGGKSQCLMFTKAGAAGVAARSNSLWNVGAVPAAGGVGGTTGTGRACTRTTTGALTQQNAAGGDQLHLTTLTVQASVAGQMLLLYDRLWDMTHTMTVDPRSVDSVNPPTRYQTAALAPGSFISGEVTTVLPAATPTLTCDYMDQDGNASTSQTLSTIASAAAVNTVPFTAPHWFVPLATADTGLRRMGDAGAGTNAFNLSAAMASGVVNWFIGHPLAFVPMPLANFPVILDGINSAFNLMRVFDDAALCFLEIAKSATTATNWWGAIQLVSG